MKKLKSIFSIVLLLSILLSITPKSYAAPLSPLNYTITRKNKEDLVTNVSNISNAKISFNLNIPAGETVSYKVELIPNKRSGSIDTISGEYKNTGNSILTKSITASTRYYSNKYTITATYTTGSSRSKIIYTDVDEAISALKTTVYSTKFVWNDENIRKWKAGQAIFVILSFSITGTADILVTKGILSGKLATSLGLSFLISDISTSGTVASTKTIIYTPIKGWAYQFKLSPYNGGYTRYLLIYDDKGKLHETLNWGNIPLSMISYAYR